MVNAGVAGVSVEVVDAEVAARWMACTAGVVREEDGRDAAGLPEDLDELFMAVEGLAIPASARATLLLAVDALRERAFRARMARADADDRVDLEADRAFQARWTELALARCRAEAVGGR